ncbi:hypothetical protein CLV42_1051 [Chitinophaga ginsengisoli]|uniref:Uncharacterized protein n=1 Tax=Chitinophaga ginsengisoli TaxID=363837 RepID=A0A2P8G9I9_9BACT|nr:hypothetical protein CLV42_1051 [Chitinophaga ginsengisoli]
MVPRYFFVLFFTKNKESASITFETPSLIVARGDNPGYTHVPGERK